MIRRKGRMSREIREMFTPEELELLKKPAPKPGEVQQVWIAELFMILQIILKIWDFIKTMKKSEQVAIFAKVKDAKKARNVKALEAILNQVAHPNGI